MDWVVFGLIAGFSTVGGLLAGVAIQLIGGTGVTRQHSRALKAINDDLDALDARITRDQNRRKADASVAARQEAKSAQALKEEADALLLKKPDTPREPICPGFGGQFSHG